MIQFLVIYRRSTGELVSITEFTGDRRRALDARFEAEARVKDDPDVEVVLLSAPTLEALRQTHSRYFKTVRELASALGDALPK